MSIIRSEKLGKKGKEYQEEYKKIALRFLKEAGILAQWRNYLSSNRKQYLMNNEYLPCEEEPLNEGNWHKVYYIDQVFGRTYITKYLNEHGYKIRGFSISSLFRTYLEKYYPKEYAHKYWGVVNSEVRVAIEKAETFNITEFQKHIRSYEKQS